MSILLSSFDASLCTSSVMASETKLRYKFGTTCYHRCVQKYLLYYRNFKTVVLSIQPENFKKVMLLLFPHRKKIAATSKHCRYHDCMISSDSSNHSLQSFFLFQCLYYSVLPSNSLSEDKFRQISPTTILTGELTESQIWKKKKG